MELNDTDTEYYTGTRTYNADPHFTCPDALGPCANGLGQVCDAKDEWNWYDEYKDCAAPDASYYCLSYS